MQVKGHLPSHWSSILDCCRHTIAIAMRLFGTSTAKIITSLQLCNPNKFSLSLSIHLPLIHTLKIPNRIAITTTTTTTNIYPQDEVVNQSLKLNYYYCKKNYTSYQRKFNFQLLATISYKLSPLLSPLFPCA